jgi:hypothetical protein
MERNYTNTEKEEQFYASFRHAPIPDMHRLTKAALSSRFRETTDALHAAMEARRERDLPTTRMLKERLGADSLPPVPPLIRNKPSASERESLLALGSNAPKKRIIRLGSAHVKDYPPYDNQDFWSNLSGSGESDQSGVQLANNEVFVNANAGFGSSGTVTATSWVAQYFYVPNPPCSITSGTLNFTTPFVYWASGNDSKRFSFASVSLSLVQMIIQFDPAGEIVAVFPSFAPFSIWNDGGWNVDQNVASPILQGTTTLVSTLAVSSQYYYSCLAGCQVVLQSDGDFNTEGASGAIDATIPYMAFDLWP